MQEYKIFIYKDKYGKSPFLTWLSSIKDVKTQRRIKLRIERLDCGNFGDYKSLGENLYELRLFFGQGYRIYYTIEDDCVIILLMGGDKSTQAADIKKAKDYIRDYKGELS